MTQSTKCLRYTNPKHNVKAWRNFGKACELASRQGVTTAMITGKGEPTLFPQEVSDYTKQLDAYGFAFIELQTNGLRLMNGDLDAYLKDWWDKGMTHIALSVVGWQNEANHQIYCPHWTQAPDYKALISKLHSYNFAVRLCCIMAKGFTRTVNDVKALVDFCKSNNVEQLTIRGVQQPNSVDSQDADAVATLKWVAQHHLEVAELREIERWLDSEHKLLMTLSYGAKVYDVNGQNLCLSNCLTIRPSTDEVRQLIYFPDGSLRWDWQYEGARLL